MITEPFKKFWPYLEEGEKILWAGRPVQGWRASPTYWIVALSCLGMLFFSVFWTWSLVVGGGHWMYVVTGIAFIMIATRFVIGDPLPNMVWRSRLYIGLSNRRLMLLNTGWPVQFHAWDLETLPRPRAAMGRPTEVALFWGVPRKRHIPNPLLMPWDSPLPEYLNAGWEPDPEPEERRRMRGEGKWDAKSV